MGRLREIVTPLHRRTAREYLPRMADAKVEAMQVACRYGQEYWDGDRRYGYGGYRYDGRWEPVARALVDTYKLPPDARILDIGCGKGYLLHEFTRILPGAQVTGIDISEYAVAQAKEEIRPHLRVHPAQEPLPFGDEQFDLVVSLNTLHNLKLFDLWMALSQIQRCAKHKYLVVESYRDCRELFNLQCWALTCQAFFTPQEWIWLFEQSGYDGDYEFIYFE